jgi:predicted dehydrogenase
MPNEKNHYLPVKYDIIGCGSVSQNIHLPVLLHLFKNQYLTVGTCYDTNIANAEKMAASFNAAFSDKISEIKNSDCDLAFIATPVNSHFSIAQQCLENGKDVFIEKPYVTSAIEAKKLSGLILENQKKIFVGHIRRFYPAMQIARKYIASGALGKIKKIEASEGGRWMWGTSSDYLISNKYGNVIYETGSHLLDTVLFVLSLDQPECELEYEIKYVNKKPADRSSHEIKSEMILKKANAENIELAIQLSRVQALPNFVKVYGEKEILLIPNGYPSAVSIVSGKNVFELNDPAIHKMPADFSGCVLLEHLEIIKSLHNRKHKSIIDCDNFINLSAILESLISFSD